MGMYAESAGAGLTDAEAIAAMGGPAVPGGVSAAGGAASSAAAAAAEEADSSSSRGDDTKLVGSAAQTTLFPPQARCDGWGGEGLVRGAPLHSPPPPW